MGLVSGRCKAADVRFGSIATDPFRVSVERCPLRSESDHHPSRDRLTLCTPGPRAHCTLPVIVERQVEAA
jgi:hypothetical protein